MLRSFRALIPILLLTLTAQAQTRADAEDRYSRGLRLYSKGDFDGAIAEFTKAIEIYTFSGRARSGPSWNSRANLTNQASDSERIIFIDPFIAEMYADRALPRYRQGDFEGALADCDRAISINPGLTRAYNNRAMIRWRSGDLDGALVDLNRLISMDASNALAYDSRGYIHMQQGNLKAAIADFDQAIRQKSDDADLYCN